MSVLFGTIQNSFILEQYSSWKVAWDIYQWLESYIRASVLASMQYVAWLLLDMILQNLSHPLHASDFYNSNDNKPNGPH